MFLFVALGRVAYWWAIPTAVIIEATVLRYALKIGWRKALVVSFLVNIASGIVGIPLYPAMGMMFYPIIAPLVTGIFGFGVLVEAAATFAALVALDTSIEFLTLVLLRQRLRVPTGAWTAAWLAAANILSTCLLVAVIATVPNLPAVNFDAGRPETLSEVEMARVAAHYDEEFQFMRKLGDALFNGEGLSGSRLLPGWVQAKRKEASSMNFSELAIVINSGPEKQFVTATFLVGRANGRDPNVWLYGGKYDAHGCLSSEPVCFSRFKKENGVTSYRASMGYGRLDHNIGIGAVFAAPN
jgi:hypothetical protein